MLVDYIIELIVAVLFGAIIGFEREYRSKAAGFRTITLITLGSTLFTILSFHFGSGTTNDRIASNIVMGIGFIGAGVIFKDTFSVSGLTTAASIWVAAAIGMAIGLGKYDIASATVILALIILALFEKIQDWIDHYHQVRSYEIAYDGNNFQRCKGHVEEELRKIGLRFKIKRSMRTSEDVRFTYIVSGNGPRQQRFNDFLINLRDVKAFNE